jgi:hypothetical protein
MPNKKGSRVAASQARAKSAAKKKNHSAGPDLAAAAQAPESTDALAQEQEEGSAVAVVEASGEELEAAAQAPTLAPRRTGRAASRRERQALTVMSAGSLRREVLMIGSVTALMGITLAVIKLVTDLGR